jgi:hypothetical protein
MSCPMLSGKRHQMPINSLSSTWVQASSDIVQRAAFFAICQWLNLHSFLDWSVALWTPLAAPIHNSGLLMRSLDLSCLSFDFVTNFIPPFLETENPFLLNFSDVCIGGKKQDIILEYAVRLPVRADYSFIHTVHTGFVGHTVPWVTEIMRPERPADRQVTSIHGESTLYTTKQITRCNSEI